MREEDKEEKVVCVVTLYSAKDYAVFGTIEVQHKIGEGAFGKAKVFCCCQKILNRVFIGEVFKGMWGSSEVALKSINSQQLQELMHECKILRSAKIQLHITVPDTT